MADKNKTVCFTGHRKIKEENLILLADEIERAIKKGYDTFLSGGAVGFDQYAALKVIKLKQKYKSIRLILVLPCNKEAMSKKWNDREKGVFNYIYNNADDVILVCEEYYDGCLKERNKRLTELSSYCIAYYKRFKSGTGQTVRMAEKNKSVVINIAENKQQALPLKGDKGRGGLNLEKQP